MPADPLPSAIIVMGVSGSGKSTIAATLAIRLGWTYQDGDWFHPAVNIEKMHSGQPLTDEDRWPWLEAISACIEATRQTGGHCVIACSALKRAYRDFLVGNQNDVRVVYLKGERALIARRMALRNGHFMPPSLLDSQFAALEEPAEEEHAIVVSVDATPAQVVETIIVKLGFGLVPISAGTSGM
jgi:carbohydrate kinase (thermoresistant glucokinase family)